MIRVHTQNKLRILAHESNSNWPKLFVIACQVKIVTGVQNSTYYYEQSNKNTYPVIIGNIIKECRIRPFFSETS